MLGHIASSRTVCSRPAEELVSAIFRTVGRTHAAATPAAKPLIRLPGRCGWRQFQVMLPYSLRDVVMDSRRSWIVSLWAVALAAGALCSTGALPPVCDLVGDGVARLRGILGRLGGIIHPCIRWRRNRERHAARLTQSAKMGADICQSPLVAGRTPTAPPGSVAIYCFRLTCSLAAASTRCDEVTWGAYDELAAVLFRVAWAPGWCGHPRGQLDQPAMASWIMLTRPPIPVAL